MKQNWHHPAVAPFPCMAHRDKCSSKQSSLFFSLTPGWWINCSKLHFLSSFYWFYRGYSVYTEVVFMMASIFEHPHAKMPQYGAFIFLRGTLREVLWPCCGCQVLSGWTPHNGHSKSKAALWERKDVSGWNKEKDSCVCHKGCERFGVSGGILHFKYKGHFHGRPPSINISSHLCIYLYIFCRLLIEF